MSLDHRPTTKKIMSDKVGGIFLWDAITILGINFFLFVCGFGGSLWNRIQIIPCLLAAMWGGVYFLRIKYGKQSLFYFAEHIYLHLFDKEKLFVSSHPADRNRIETDFDIDDTYTTWKMKELTATEKKHLSELTSLQDKLPYRDILSENKHGNNIGVLRNWDGSISCTMLLGGIDLLTECSTEDELVALRDMLNVFFENRKTNFKYVLQYSVNSNYHRELSVYKKVDEGALDDLKNLHEIRSEYINEEIRAGEIRKINIFLTIQYSGQENFLKKDVLFDLAKSITFKTKKIVQKKADAEQVKINTLLKEAFSVADSFKGYFLCKYLTADDLLFYAYEFFNKNMANNPNIPVPNFHNYQEYKEDIIKTYKENKKKINRLYRDEEISKPERNEALETLKLEMEFNTKKHLSVLDMICCQDIDRSDLDVIQLDGYYHKYITYMMHPDTEHLSQLYMDVLMQDFNDYDVFLKFWPLDKTMEIAWLKFRGNIKGLVSNFSIFGKKKEQSNDADDIQKKQEKDFLNFYRLKLMTTNLQKYQMGLVVRVSAKTKEEVEEKARKIEFSFHSIAGCNAREDKAGIFRILTDNVPFYVKKTKRDLSTDSEQLADMLPVYKKYNGYGKESILFYKNSNQELVPVNPYYAEPPHILLAGGSGSGKSFNVNYILDHIYVKHPQAHTVIVDRSGAYEGYVESLNGNMINFWDGQSNFVFNPFELSSPEELFDKKKGKKRFILGFLETLWGDEGDNGLIKLDKYTKELIDIILCEVVAQKEKELKAEGKPWVSPTISDFYNVIIADEGKEVDRILSKHNHDIGLFREAKTHLKIMVKDTIEGTEIGKYFDGQSTVKLFGADNKVTYFDFQNLKEQPRLTSAIMYLVLNVISEKLDRLPTDIPKIAVFDECWSFLNSHSIIEVIKEIYRAGRAKNFMGISLSQSLADFMEEVLAAIRNAILPNIKNVFVYKHENISESLKRFMHEDLQLNDEQINEIRNLHTQKGEYAECYLVQKGLATGKIRIEVNTIDYWRYTTNPVEKEYRRWVVKENGCNYNEAAVAIANNEVIDFEEWQRTNMNSFVNEKAS